MRTYRARTTQTAFEVKLKSKASIGEIIINYYFFFDSKRHPKRNLENGQSLGAGIAVLSAKARLCLASAEDYSGTMVVSFPPTVGGL